MVQYIAHSPLSEKLFAPSFFATTHTTASPDMDSLYYLIMIIYLQQPDKAVEDICYGMLYTLCIVSIHASVICKL